MRLRWLSLALALTLGAPAVQAQTAPLQTSGFVQASFVGYISSRSRA